MKPSEFLDVLEKRAETVRSARDDKAELLLTLLAHLFGADKKLDGRELSAMRSLVPDIENLNTYLAGLQSRPLDLDAIAQAYPDPEDRRDILQLVEHAMWADHQVDEREWSFIDRVAKALGVSRQRMSTLDLGDL